MNQLLRRILTRKVTESRMPQVGELVCHHDASHSRIVSIEDDGDTVTLENGETGSYHHCMEPAPHDDFSHRCPICGLFDGFHDDALHRNNIDPMYLKEKGWQHNQCDGRVVAYANGGTGRCRKPRSHSGECA